MGTPVIVAKFDAVGGPSKLDKGGDGFVAGPTDPGTYRIAYCGKHSSARYAAWSKIRWGSEIKEEGGEILVKHDGIFQPLKKLSPALNKQALIDRNADLYGNRELPTTWVFNDFGHMTCYFFKDLNDNRKLDATEKIHGEFFHTTPDNEAEEALGQAVTLSESHGCVHIKPTDMDTLIAKGYFKSGNRVVVYPYSQTSTPAAWKNEANGRAPYSVHFFPGAKQLLVVGSRPKKK